MMADLPYPAAKKGASFIVRLLSRVQRSRLCVLSDTLIPLLPDLEHLDGSYSWS